MVYIEIFKMIMFNEMKGDWILVCICWLIGIWLLLMICFLFIVFFYCVFMKGWLFFDLLEGSYFEGEINLSFDFIVD